MNIPDWPEPIADALSSFATDGTDFRTASESNVYRFEDGSGNAVYVKVQGKTWSPPLARERDIMVWLSGKLPVPKVVAYHKEDKTEYLVTGALEGLPSHDRKTHVNKQHLVEALAHQLHQIHAVSIEDCPFDRTPDALISLGRERIAGGIVTQHMIDEVELTGSPERALDEMADRKPTSDKYVFTHGDYCLPNILIENSRASGLIDLGYAGVGDRHRDFECAYYSVRRNLGEEWVTPFFEAYGVSPDEDKLNWYGQISAFH